MAERRLMVRRKGTEGPIAPVALIAAERNGRWIVRAKILDAGAVAQDWPGLVAEDHTQRLWVGSSEVEAYDNATNWLRTEYEVKDAT